MKYPRGWLQALAAMAVCGIVACSTAPPRSEAERAADAAIAAQVEAALRGDPSLYAQHIVVAVDRGVVRLGGLVWSDEELQLASRDAASVSGVRTVVSDMELVRGGISGRK